MIRFMIMIASICVIIIIFKNKKENNYNVDEANPYKTGCYVVRSIPQIRRIVIIGFSLFTLMLYLGLSKIVSGNASASDIRGIIIIFLFWCFGFLLMLYFYNWEIKVESKEIYYRNFFRRVKKYQFEEISVYLKEDATVVATYNEKKIFEIGGFVENKKYFVYWAKKLKRVVS